MLKNIIKITSVDVILKVLGYLLLPVYLNLMTKEDYGEFGYINSVIGALPPILTLGLYVSLIKVQSESKNIREKKEILSSILTFTILFVFVFCMVAAVFRLTEKFFEFRLAAPAQLTLKNISVLVLVLFSTLNLIVYSYAVSLQKSLVIVKYNIFKFLTANIFGIGFLIFISGSSDDSLKRLYGFAAAEIILFGATYLWLCKDQFEFRINFTVVKKYLKTGMLLVPGSCASLVTVGSDRYFLNYNFGLSYVAEYNLAMQFVLPMQLIMTGAQTIWAPHVFSIADGKVAFEASTSFLRKVTILFVTGLALISAAVYAAVSLSIIPSIYQDVVLLVPVFGLSAIFLAMTHIFQNLFVKLNHGQYVSYLLISGAVMSVIGGYFLIPVFGYWAAAVLSVFINASLLATSFKIAKRIAFT